MQYQTHHLILFFLSLLSTTTPTAAYPSTPGALPKSPYPINAPSKSQTEILTNEDLSYSYAKPPASNNLETANAPTLPKRRGGEGDNRRGLPSITPEIANPIPLPHPKRKGISSNNLPLQQRWLPSNTPKTSNPLPLPLHKRRGGEGDNRRWLPTSDSGLSATEIENFLSNPGGIVDNAREVLVVHDVSDGGSRGRRGG